jgi:hypothetical protein
LPIEREDRLASKQAHQLRPPLRGMGLLNLSRT